MNRFMYWLTQEKENGCHSFCPKCNHYEDCVNTKDEKNKSMSSQKTEVDQSKQVLDAIAITERTACPESFFGYYEFAVKMSFTLSQQNGNIMIGEDSAQEVLIMLLEERDERIIDFINRCYWKNYDALFLYVEKNHPTMGEEAKEYYNNEYDSWQEEKEEEMRMLKEEREEAIGRAARAYAASQPWN